jgi:predicted nucleotidyltransferase
MTTISEIKDILNRHKSYIKERFKVDEIGIFGSYVRSEQTNESDVDVLVTFKEPIDFFLFLDLEDYLSDLIGKKVDLVMKRALKPDIGKSIIEETIYV